MTSTFKKTLIGASLVSLLAVSGASLAGPRGGHGAEHRGPGERIERLSQTLSLDDNQRQAIEDIFREQRQAQSQVRAETESKIASVLTPEQKQQLDTLRAERQAKWEERKARFEERRAARAERGDRGDRGARATR